MATLSKHPDLRGCAFAKYVLNAFLESDAWLAHGFTTSTAAKAEKDFDVDGSNPLMQSLRQWIEQDDGGG